MKKIVITYGLIAGFITGGLMLATMPLFENGVLDFENGAVIGYTGMVIALSLIFFGVKSYRDHHAQGTITFGKGFLMGLGITAIASVLYASSWEVTYARSGEKFMQKWTDMEVAKLKSNNATEAELKKAQEDWKAFAEMYKNPVVRFGMTLTEIFPVGILISLVSATLLRKKDFLPISNQP